jgi:hypothetical protein
MTDPAATGNGRPNRGRKLVTLGVMGLSRWESGRVHAFRRELEQAVSGAFAGAVPIAAREKVRAAGYAYAAILRGHTTLQQAIRGEIALTFAQREEVEQRIGRASDRLDRALTALGLPTRPPTAEEKEAAKWNALIQGFGLDGFPTPPAARQRTNGAEDDPMPTTTPTTRQSGFNATGTGAEPTAPDRLSDALGAEQAEKHDGKQHSAAQAEKPDNRERLSTVQSKAE